MPLRALCVHIGWAVVLAAALGACQSDRDAPGEARSALDSTEAVAFRDTLTLTGTLIDATCHAQTDPDATASCEGKYVRAGYPAAVRVRGDSAAVWILVTVPQALADYLTATVRVTGVVRSEGVLIPHRMAIRDGSAWTSIM